LKFITNKLLYIFASFSDLNLEPGLSLPYLEKLDEFLDYILDRYKHDEAFHNIPEEWQEFTLYKGAYNKDHIVIKWFWEILSEFTQKELSNLLLFATGASRVPLGGFEVLESNGGNIYKFTIEYINYDNYHKNFIKAHTCFNRIDLPCYPKKDELEEAYRKQRNEINSVISDLTAVQNETE